MSVFDGLEDGFVSRVAALDAVLAPRDSLAVQDYCFNKVS